MRKCSFAVKEFQTVPCCTILLSGEGRNSFQWRRGGPFGGEGGIYFSCQRGKFILAISGNFTKASMGKSILAAMREIHMSGDGEIHKSVNGKICPGSRSEVEIHLSSTIKRDIQWATRGKSHL